MFMQNALRITSKCDDGLPILAEGEIVRNFTKIYGFSGKSRTEFV
jgi:hypothetical protein